MTSHDAIRAQTVRLAGRLLAGQEDGSPARPRVSDGDSDGDGEGELMVSDLDSFSLIELALSLEDLVGVPILDELADFPGGTVGDLAAFALRLAARQRPDGQR